MGTTVPSGMVVVVGAAVRFIGCCAEASPTAVRSISVIKSPNFGTALKFGRMDSFLYLFVCLFGFVDGEFSGIDQQHHEHAAGENIVRRDLALVMRVPHKRPTALVGGVGLYVGRKQSGAVRSRRGAAGGHCSTQRCI